ncbi:GDSL/SGNH-like acyl-esterase family found in Pmr5 and Cas1p-domain-containing protein [Jimgerdemannia flammicorona]|uniref:GDSL/SGNH-like acyl-esterase family found in Pmr5 and Cas1p-domain-containing protein n=1 Tax=Jimgerdemannia flammicorona TaxID=994334 RepID=A0A433Q7B8_9FUNG|nr:GDSL/SGNH-like acyl-esterase family found in Pmr5 and Cas1p-domain-containing protein [Jimgerdemannia flammicorona]
MLLHIPNPLSAVPSVRYGVFAASVAIAFAISLLKLYQYGACVDINEEEYQTSLRTQQQRAQNLPPGTFFCTPSSFNNGTHVRRPLGFVRTVDELIYKAGYRCTSGGSKDLTQEELVRKKRAMEWTWEPTSCALLEFDPLLFTRHLERNPLLFIGDSISRQQFISLRCLLGDYVRKIDDPFSDSTFFMPDKYSAEWRIQLSSVAVRENRTMSMFLRSDFLVRSRDLDVIKPGEDLELKRDPFNFAWSHLVPEFKYVVINTGAHWNKHVFNTSLPILEAYQIMINKVLEYFTTKHPCVRVFIRGSVYGHFNCSQYTEPLLNPRLPMPIAGQHNWYDMLTMNELWKTSIHDFGNPQITYFDVSFTELRADSHADPKKPDCLHYLLPGPMDSWNRLLYHELFKKLL